MTNPHIHGMTRAQREAARARRRLLKREKKQIRDAQALAAAREHWLMQGEPEPAPAAATETLT